MERVEAALHGWPQAPYRHASSRWTPTSSGWSSTAAGPSTRGPCTSASPATTSSTWPTASLLREEHGVEAWVEFEMLEGMANHQARAVQARAGGLLLYAPVVRAEDFHSAIAYLVRRLDENTAPDNFLRHVFGLEPGSPDWELERDRFLAAFELLDGLSDAPRRTQDRAAEARAKRRGRRSGSPSRTSPTPTGRSPPTGTGSRRSSRAGASGRRSRCRCRSAASSSHGAAAGRRRDPLAPGPGRLSLRPRRPRAGGPGARRGPRRAAGLGGRPSAERRAPARRARRRCSPAGAAI